MPFIAWEQQSSLNKKLRLTYIVKVNIGVLRSCYIGLTNNDSLPELSFLLRSTDTQITTSRGFSAELWNIPWTYLHYRIFKCLTWRQVDRALNLSMKWLGIIISHVESNSKTKIHSDTGVFSPTMHCEKKPGKITLLEF